MILENGTILNERYQIESMVGQGGMSYVYRAQDRKMGRLVAVKVLKEEYCDDEEFIKKFQNEAQAAAKLNHPNIVAAYDVVDDEEKKLHYIVMELVEGITLKNYIQRKGRLNNRETIGIALQVIDGIEQAHKMGIVHRDIKPQNMIVGTDGVVKVADFGIARAATQQTVNATVMGSVHYISPEQARSGVSDERSDIYSLGCTLYEMLTGKVPYDGDTSVAVVFSHLENPVPHISDLVPDVYPALDKAVYKCMMKKSNYRYQHIGELGEDLQRALENPEGNYISIPDPEKGNLNGKSLKDDENDSKVQVQDEEEYEDGIGTGMNRLYKVIATVCVIMIVALILFLGNRIFRFILSGNAIESTAMESSSAAESETETVSITISALETRLPDIIGKTVQDASEYLSDYNMRIYKTEEEYSDTYGAGLIISYPDGDYSTGDLIPVTVSKGNATIVFYDADNPEDLSDLQSRKFTDLQKELEDREIPYRYSMEFSDDVPDGNVIWTNKPDTSGAEELEITVSQGSSEYRTLVPDLRGYTESDAAQILYDAWLNLGSVSFEANEDVEAGQIISQSAAANSVMDKGSYVNIVISSGADGESYVGSSERNSSNRDYWYGSLNQTVTIGSGGPGIDGSMLISIRLRQDIGGESIYTTLQSARTYTLGTELQVIFSRIKGMEGIPTGVVEVVDAENDSVLASYEVEFNP